MKGEVTWISGALMLASVVRIQLRTLKVSNRCAQHCRARPATSDNLIHMRITRGTSKLFVSTVNHHSYASID